MTNIRRLHLHVVPMELAPTGRYKARCGAVIPSGSFDSFHKLRSTFVPLALVGISILFPFFELDFRCWQFQLIPAGIGLHLDHELCCPRQCSAFSRFKLTAPAIWSSCLCLQPRGVVWAELAIDRQTAAGLPADKILLSIPSHGNTYCYGSRIDARSGQDV